MRAFFPIHNLKLLVKLALLLLIPTCGLLVFAGAQTWERYAALRQMEAVVDLARLNSQLSELVHELQKERGRTGILMASSDPQGRQALTAQRALTDPELAALRTVLNRFERAGYGAAFAQGLDSLEHQLDGLGSHRRAVDAGSVSTAEALGYYTTTITAMLDLGSSIANVTASGEVARRVTADAAIARAKEQTGIERAMLSNAFTRGEFAPGQFEQFVALRAAQATYLGSFRAAATPEQDAFYQATMQGPAVDAVAQMEQVALQSATAPGLGAVDANVWFDQMTTKIDLLKQVEGQLASDILALATQRSHEARAGLLFALLLGAGVLLLTIVGSYVLVRSIVRPVQALTRAADGLAVGDLAQHIAYHGRDELGQLADSFRRLIAYLQDMAQVAEAMAQGDLTRDQQPRSERDVLGNAFQRMLGGLRGLLTDVRTAADGLAATSEELGTVASQTGQAVEQVTMAVQQVAQGAQGQAMAAQESHRLVANVLEAIEQVAGGAREQAQSVGSATASTTQMADGIAQVATNAESVAAASQQTRAAAQQGAQAVQQTVSLMSAIASGVTRAADKVEELGHLGERIGAVVETIDDIAEQTNLLALNAAIEAARAGEHGRGFAVVADEVRKLAERSQRETRAIGELIRDVQRGTHDAVQAMNDGASQVQAGSSQADEAVQALATILHAVEATVERAGEIVTAAQTMAARGRDVSETMTGIARVVEEASATTAEMAGAADSVGRAIGEIAAVAEENSAASEEVSASAEEMSAQVEEMSAQAAELAATAAQLRALVARFRIDGSAAAPSTVAPSLRRAA